MKRVEKNSCDWRENIGKVIVRQGVPSAAVPAAAHADPSLAHAPLCSHLPWLLTTLIPIAAFDLLTAVPASTGTIGAAVEVIETVVCGTMWLRPFWRSREEALADRSFLHNEWSPST